MEKTSIKKNPHKKTRVIIMGAAGRDFHDFNMFFRDNPNYEVVAFTQTHTQELGVLPEMPERTYPKELAGRLYPNGIPIYPENGLEGLIKKHRIDKVVFSYSDMSHEYVMHKASLILAAGANFALLGQDKIMIKSKKPVVSICAVRTGCGKSQTSRKVCKILKDMGYKVVAIREPMPYGDLRKQICMRFANYSDLDKNECTIEEREEYEPYIERGFVVYSGVDYGKILEKAEKEADIIVWDGGNNEISFYKPDLLIVVADPHRPGHELTYHPGEVNLRTADVVVINKEDTAKKENIKIVEKNIRSANPRAVIIHANSAVTVERPELIKGKKVLVIEDGPTLTHGGAKFGAGVVVARKFNSKLVNPKPHAVGSIKHIYEEYPRLEEGKILPAMGYSKNQIKELEKTINKTPCDAVISGTPIDLTKFLKINKPVVRVRYELEEKGKTNLELVLKKFFKKKQS